MQYYAYKRIQDGTLVTGTDYSGGITNTGFRTQTCNSGLPPIIVSDFMNDAVNDRFQEPRATMIARMMDPSLYVPVKIDIKILEECEIKPLEKSVYDDAHFVQYFKNRETNKRTISPSTIGDRTPVKIPESNSNQ